MPPPRLRDALWVPTSFLSLVSAESEVRNRGGDDQQKKLDTMGARAPPASGPHARPAAPAASACRPHSQPARSRQKTGRGSRAARGTVPPPQNLTPIPRFLSQLALLTRVGELGRAVDVAHTCLWSTWTAVRELEVRGKEEGGRDRKQAGTPPRFVR